MIRHNNIVIDRKKLMILVGDRQHFFDRALSGHRCKHSVVAFDAISHMLLGGHYTTAMLFDHVYRHDPDGGPQVGPRIFLVHFRTGKSI